jgi:hypothetical protein
MENQLSGPFPGINLEEWFSGGRRFGGLTRVPTIIVALGQCYPLALQERNELIFLMGREPTRVFPVASFTKKHSIMREVLPVILLRSVLE